MTQARKSALVQSKFLALAALALLCTLLLAVDANPARAATTFTVNSTDDSADQNTANGICDTGIFMFPTGKPQCTLRAAIQQANATAGADEIHFSIPGTGVQTIRPATQLPAVREQVTIDGYTQPGASPNTLEKGINAVLKIELDGSIQGFGEGLSFDTGNNSSTVRGLVINRFEFAGIIIRQGEGNTIEGNFIGTNAAGDTAPGNVRDGVYVRTASNFIGGNNIDSPNVISGNGYNGLTVGDNTQDTGNQVFHNHIGTDTSGTADLGNGSSGVLVLSANTTVNGNTIAYNGQEGIGVNPSLSFEGDITGNRFRFNSIFANGGLGIDLGRDGRTANDAKDADTGTNNLQNYPVLTSAKTFRKYTLVKGKLNSTPGRTFTIQFFASPKGTRDEGKTFIGEDDGVITDATTGEGTIMVPVQKVKPGWFVTATATDDSTGDTSEFSLPKKVVRR